MVPFLFPVIILHLIFRVPKRDHNFDNYPGIETSETLEAKLPRFHSLLWMHPVLLEGSWDLVSKVISTLIGDISKK